MSSSKSGNILLCQMRGSCGETGDFSSQKWRSFTGGCTLQWWNDGVSLTMHSVPLLCTYALRFTSNLLVNAVPAYGPFRVVLYHHVCVCVCVCICVCVCVCVFACVSLCVCVQRGELSLWLFKSISDTQPSRTSWWRGVDSQTRFPVSHRLVLI